VKRLTMMVTPDGRWVFPDSDEFRAALGDADPDYDALSFAVKNLGFIKFNVIEQSMIEIELHPRNVELPALLAVQQQLHSAHVGLFRIRYFDTSWQSEISSSAAATIERLSQLCTPAYTPAPSERFVVEPLDFSLLFECEDNPFRPLAQKWRMSFGHFDPSVIALALRHQLLSRLIVIGVKPSEQEPVFRFIGDAHQWLGGSFHASAVGEQVRNQPDKEYGRWVSEFYRAIANARQPRYDLVTATLQYENESGAPRRVVRYERVLLPWKTTSDELFISVSSKLVAPPDGTNSASADSSVARKLVKSS